uniref:Uncharacterized protein n=1 Tax=uncultured bacterium contig00025 TaxID=1181514 RepID=A0A806KFK8_9BACT|nr:hypothetical protein [uncultured bacterium contig00025]
MSTVWYNIALALSISLFTPGNDNFAKESPRSINLKNSSSAD